MYLGCWFLNCGLGTLGGPPECFQESTRSGYFRNNTKILNAFCIIFSWVYGVSRVDVTCNIITLMADGMWACVFLCFTFFSVLISNMTNVNGYNPPKQKLFGILKFWVCKTKKFEHCCPRILPRSGASGLCSICNFSLRRWCHAVFQSGCANTWHRQTSV